MNTYDQTFGEWFAAFESKARELGYAGPIDRETFRDDFELEISAEDSAAAFVIEMNS